jgi:hypothetical protein
MSEPSSRRMGNASTQLNNNFRIDYTQSPATARPTRRAPTTGVVRRSNIGGPASSR